MITVGLDISTSCTGVCILDQEASIIYLDHIDFSKCKSFWEKCDYAKTELKKILEKFSIDSIYVEESLLSFSTGLSSAATIMTLAKFNALLSYFVRELCNIDPIFLSASHARKVVGIKMIPKKKCGLTFKEQSFLAMTTCDGPLAKIEFPKGRTGKFKSFCYDRVDSYIIARAGCVLNKTK